MLTDAVKYKKSKKAVLTGRSLKSEYTCIWRFFEKISAYKPLNYLNGNFAGVFLGQSL